MAIELDNAITCVTGGGRGIGRATAEALARQGARVVVGDIDLDTARETADGIGKQAIALRLDVSDPHSFTEFIATADKIGPIDLLVNNAGIMRTGSFHEQDPVGQQREININIGGVVIGTRLVLPAMLARNHGHIVNVASMAGKLSVPGAAVYTATKYAVVGLGKAVRAEIADSRVTVSTILPAVVRTELTAGLGTDNLPATDPSGVANVIVESCQSGQAEICVPSWVSPVSLFEEVIPEKLSILLKRAVGGQERITADNEHRRAYQART